MARKKARSTPAAYGGFLSYPEETPIGNFWHTISIHKPKEWQQFLSTHGIFNFEDVFTVRAEKRARGTRYFVAYRQIDGLLFKQYIGTADKVTPEKLEEIRATIVRAVRTNTWAEIAKFVSNGVCVVKE